MTATRALEDGAGPAPGPGAASGLILPLLAAFAAYAVWKQDDGVSDWTAACWLVDYHFGFVRRGLPGALLPSQGDVQHAVQVVSRSVSWALAALLTAAASWILARARPAALPVRRSLAAWLFLFLLAPFTLAQFANDSGRFDHLLHLLTLPLLCAITVGSPWRWLAVPCVPVLAAIHELALLIHLPWILALWITVARGRREPVPGSVVVLLAAAASAFVVARHGGPDVDEAAFAARLAARAPGLAVPAGFVEPYFRDAGWALQLTWERSGWRTVRHLLLLAVVGSPLWFLTVAAWRTLLRGEQRKAWLMPGSAIAGLPLFALGFDHQRWIANLVLGQWLLQLAYAQAAGKWSLLAEVVARHRIWLVLAVLASLALGPLGVTSTMEWRFALLRPR